MAWTYEITSSLGTHYAYPGNATEVLAYLTNEGYSYAAAIGVIANMEHESYVNPGQQEYGYSGSTDRGYGLVQWTPASSKILAYASSVGGNWYDGALQMAYFDINVPASWIRTKKYYITLAQYKELTDIYTATRAFFYNFERGTYTSELDNYAAYWDEYFSGVVPPTPPTPSPLDNRLLMLISGKRKKRH